MVRFYWSGLSAVKFSLDLLGKVLLYLDRTLFVVCSCINHPVSSAELIQTAFILYQAVCGSITYIIRALPLIFYEYYCHYQFLVSLCAKTLNHFWMQLSLFLKSLHQTFYRCHTNMSGMNSTRAPVFLCFGLLIIPIVCCSKNLFCYQHSNPSRATL